MTEPDVSALMTVTEAADILDSTPVEPAVVETPLEESQGLRLAEDVAADRDYPPFDRSQMDGIAARFEDLLSGELELVGEVAAGTWPTREVGENQAVRIMTGAPLPSGADTVVPVEMLESTRDRVRVVQPVKKGNAIVRRGAEVRAGQVVLRRGTLLEPAHLAVAATVGAAVLKTCARPRAAVLATGDELVDPDGAPGPGQIRNANSVMLCGLLWKLGCDVTDLGTSPDRPDVLREKLREGLTDFDLLFVSGGMSMGDYDYVPAVLQELGVTPRITKLKIKPGKPFLFGTRGEAADDVPSSYVFGLPGNPVSSFVCAVLLASRLITRLAGGKPQPRLTSRKLSAALPANGPREFYQPAILSGDHVHPLQWKGSADVFTLAAANGLLVRPENQPALPAGATVQVLEI